MIERTCGRCAYMQHNSGVCPLFNQSFSPEEPGCPKFTSTVHSCEVCGSLTDLPIISIDKDHSNHAWCENCDRLKYSCAICVEGNTCSFKNDPSPIPLTIQKEVRQGNMIMVTDAPNPERIRQTCMKGCPCFDKENGCLKQFNTCENWSVKYEKV